MEYIDLNKILRNFENISISLIDFSMSIKDEERKLVNVDSLTRNFIDKLKLSNIGISSHNVDSVIITKNGIYYKGNEFMVSIINSSNKEKCINHIIKNLKEISSVEILKDLYPSLFSKYNKLIDEDIEIKALKELKKLNNERYFIYDDDEDTVHRKKLNSFIRSQISELEKIKNYGVDNYLRAMKLSSCIMECIDPKNLELVIAESVRKTSLFHDDRVVYNTCINYMKEYIKNNNDLLNDEYSIELGYINNSGIRINKIIKIKDIDDYLKEIELAKKEKNTTSERINEEEITEKKYNDKEINKEEKYSFSFFQCQSEKDSKKVLRHFTKYLDRSEESEEKKTLLRDKIDYYDNLGYTKIYIGQDSFDGYIGFVLDNGIVIMDKLYNNFKSKTIATEEAIYITTINDFEKVASLSKTECIRQIKENKLNVRRVLHSEGWQKRTTNLSKKMKNKKC